MKPGLLLAAAALVLGTGIGWLRPAASGADRNPRPPLSTKAATTRTGTPPTTKAARTKVSGSARAERDRILSITPPPDRLRALIHFANRIPTATLEAWVDPGALNSGDRMQDDVFHRIVSERLAVADPGVAIAGAAQRGKSYEAKLLAWMRDDPDAAEHFLLGLRPSSLRRRLTAIRGRFTTIAVKEWARSDPERALILLDSAARRNRVELAWTLVRDLPPLAETHRDALVALSRQWPSQWRHCIQVAAAKPGWMNDPAGTTTWMKKQGMSAEVFAQVLYELAGRRPPPPSALDYLDLIPEPWLETAARRADYAVVRPDPLGWLAAEADVLGIAPALLDKLQCEAAAQLQGRGDPIALMDGATPTVQAALAVATVNRGFYSDPEGTGQWVEALEDPAVREAAQSRFNVLAKPKEAHPWLYNRPKPRPLDGPAPSPPAPPPSPQDQPHR